MSRLTWLGMVYTKKIDRETLVVIASDLLEQEGIDAISMRRLAGALDVRASSLYHHFADNSALLAAIAEMGLRRLAAELVRARAWAIPAVHLRIRSLRMA